LNQGREETIDELFSPNGVAHGLGDTEADVRGPQQFKPFVRKLRSSLPDVHISVEDVIAENDLVGGCAGDFGTHRGHGLGIAPSGNRSGLRVSRSFASPTNER
jgi:predicted ester cyclase